MLKRTAILALLGPLALAAPTVAAQQKLTRGQAHHATVLRLKMLLKEWPGVVSAYTVVPVKHCKRHSARTISCGYTITNEPEGTSGSIVCTGNARVNLNHGNSKTVNVGVTLGTCTSKGGWSPRWST